VGGSTVAAQIGVSVTDWLCGGGNNGDIGGDYRRRKGDYGGGINRNGASTGYGAGGNDGL
jgi:hypothetical protein